MSNLFANGKYIFCSNPRDPRKLFFSKLISQYEQNKKDRGSLPLSFCYKRKKASTFQSRPLYSSAISFRLPSDSISAAASSDSPLLSAFTSNLSGPSVPRLSPLPFRFLTPAVSAFFRPLQFWVLTTQPSALSFPCFPYSPVGGSYGASFLFRSACFHAVLPISVLSSLQFLSPSAVSPHSGYLDASASSFRFRPLPLAFALGSVTQLKRSPLRDTRQPLTYVSRQLGYNSTSSIICQHLFSKFFNKFYFSFLGTSTRTSVLVITNISTYHPLLRVR